MPKFFDPLTGKLHEHSERTLDVLCPWPRPMAFQRSLKEPNWQAFRPALRIPALPETLSGFGRGVHESTPRRGGEPQLVLSFEGPLDGDDLDGQALRAYCDLVPLEIRRVIARYPEQQWDLLVLTARAGQPAIDLMASNPALAFMLASGWEFRRGPDRRPEAAAREVWQPHRKQRQLLLTVGLPPRESLRRLLRKIPYESISQARLLALRSRLADGALVRRLASLPRVNANVMQMAADSTLDSVSSQLLLLAAERREDDRVPHLADLLREVVMMWRTNRPGVAVPCFDTLEAIHLTHQECSRLLPPQGVVGLTQRRSGGLAVQVSVVPLKTLASLQEEGRCQRNCVATLWPAVAVGQLSVYRLLEPERGTLSLRRGARGWRLEQLKAARNRRVRPATRAAVRAWLNDLQPATG